MTYEFRVVLFSYGVYSTKFAWHPSGVVTLPG